MRSSYLAQFVIQVQLMNSKFVPRVTCPTRDAQYHFHWYSKVYWYKSVLFIINTFLGQNSYICYTLYFHLMQIMYFYPFFILIIIKLFLNIISNIKSLFQLIKWNSEVGNTGKMAKTKKVIWKYKKKVQRHMK